ncbi:MAG: hypothetical protein WC516_09835 [Patescibacteria group bacterium]
MKEYKFLFKNGDTCIKVGVKAEDQDSARSAITYLLNSPEKFDFTLVEVAERIIVPREGDSLRRKIFEANVVYLDGKTIKDRYKKEEVSDVLIFDMFDILQIESWDEKDRILKLITVGRK